MNIYFNIIICIYVHINIYINMYIFRKFSGRQELKVRGYYKLVSVA